MRKLHTPSVAPRAAWRALGGTLALGLMFVPQQASACALCTFSLLWPVLPPLMEWSLLCIGWYVALSVVAAVAGIRLPWILRPVEALLLAFFGWCAGMILMGPLTMLPFGVAAFAAWIRQSRAEGTRPRTIKAINVTSIIAMITFGVTGVYTVVHARRMTDADVITMWEGTALQSQTLYKLSKQGTSAIPELRKVVERSSGYSGGRAAMMLSKMGDPKIDVPLMIAAIGRTEHEQYGPADDYRTALGTMTSQDLGRTATAAQWRQRWEEIKSTSASLQQKSANPR